MTQFLTSKGFIPTVLLLFGAKAIGLFAFVLLNIASSLPYQQSAFPARRPSQSWVLYWMDQKIQNDKVTSDETVNSSKQPQASLAPELPEVVVQLK